MLAEQFHAAAAAARNTATVDEIARLTWRAHAEGQLHDAEAEAFSEAAQARRAVLAGESQTQSKAVLGLPGGSARPCREKMFGLGRPRALDRNAKVRIMHWARCLSRRTEPGKAYGQVTANSPLRKCRFQFAVGARRMVTTSAAGSASMSAIRPKTSSELVCKTKMKAARASAASLGVP